MTVIGHVCVRCAYDKQPLGLVYRQYTTHDKMSNSNITQRGTQDLASASLIANMGDPVVILRMLSVLFSGTQKVFKEPRQPETKTESMD